MKTNNNNSTMTQADYEARLINIAQEVATRYESVTEYIYASLEKLSNESGKDLKAVVVDFNKTDSPFKVSYSAIKQYRYDKKQRKVKTAAATIPTKKTAYKILFDAVMAKKDKLTAKQKQSIINLLK